MVDVGGEAAAPQGDAALPMAVALHAPTRVAMKGEQRIARGNPQSRLDFDTIHLVSTDVSTVVLTTTGRRSVPYSQTNNRPSST